MDYSPALPPPLRDVVYGVALQRFLDRSFEDNDPFRQPAWPVDSAIESAFESTLGSSSGGS